MTRHVVLPATIIAVLSCAPPELTPEEASTEFVTSASTADVLDAVAMALERNGFEVTEPGRTLVGPGTMLVRGEKLSRRELGGGTHDYYFDSRIYTEMRVTIIDTGDGVRVTIEPARAFSVHYSTDRHPEPLHEEDKRMARQLEASIKKRLVNGTPKPFHGAVE